MEAKKKKTLSSHTHPGLTDRPIFEIHTGIVVLVPLSKRCETWKNRFWKRVLYFSSNLKYNIRDSDVSEIYNRHTSWRSSDSDTGAPRPRHSAPTPCLPVVTGPRTPCRTRAWSAPFTRSGVRNLFWPSFPSYMFTRHFALLTASNKAQLNQRI